MKLIQGLRHWWQNQTGEDETPFDGDSPAFFVSLIVHLVVLVALGLIPLVLSNNQVTLTITQVTEEEVEPEVKLPEEFFFSEQPAEQVGANSMAGDTVALSLASVVAEMSEVPQEQVELDPVGDIAVNEVNEAIKVATALNFSPNSIVKGAAGEGTTGAAGAIDRITHEILLSLEERKTLVVWLFDSTASLVPQRQAIHDRFDRIHKELGIIEAAGNEAFTKHAEKPLLSSVVSFGSTVKLMTKEPTDSISELKQAVAAIENDDSGMENVFTAIHDSAKKFASYRQTSEVQAEPARNVMLVVFTDEAGSDWQNGMDPTIQMCRRWAMPVYVVGVPAPFGRRETQMKWVDPDPKYDQSAQWGVVDQGPETLYPERLKLAFSGSGLDEEPIDSGFGPYGLTRLCVETGGIYFTVHPNRNVNRSVNKQETAAFSSHIKYFFDPSVMRKYRPDYVSLNEYNKRVSQNMARRKLVEASMGSQLTQMDNPTLRFVKSDEAAFSEALSEAQKSAAALEPKINMLFETLRQGEADREKEASPRWQAGYDLAMGRVIAVKARTEAYNGMLAAAKRGLKFKDPKNNTWVLTPANEVSVGSALSKLADKAHVYLDRVVKDHPDTPWALLAENELKTPIGWKWEEEFTDLTPRNNNNNAAAAPAPANDKKMMLQKPPAKRPPPKL